jgi:hypothetical protein
MQSSQQLAQQLANARVAVPSSVDADLTDLRSRLTAAEGSITALQTAVADLTTRVEALETP